ncbi:MAG: hypothetical protein RL685_3928, partial [Pseudomonadota bacterium]
MRLSSIDSSRPRDLTFTRRALCSHIPCSPTPACHLQSGHLRPRHVPSGRAPIPRVWALAALWAAASSFACSDDPRGPSTVSGPLLGGDGAPGESGAPILPGGGLPGGNGSGTPGDGVTYRGTELVGFVDGEGDGRPPSNACSDRFAPAAARPPLIQFVVDTSGSMAWVPGTDRAPQSGELSKWQITQQALATAIAAMPDDVGVGVTYYPNTLQNGQCYRPEVAAPLAALSTEQRGQIQQVNSAMRPFGGTPTHGAYAFGVEQLQASTLEG